MEDKRSGDISRFKAGGFSKTQNCTGCNEEYQANYITIFATPRDLSAGTCRKCSDIIIAEREAEEEAQRLADIAHIRTEARQRTGIPVRFMAQDFSTFDKQYQGKAFDKCWKYAESFPVERRTAGQPSLIIYSKNSWGVGKTHLSAAIMHRILDRWAGEGRGCPRMVFMSEYDLFRNIQATFNYSAEDRRLRESEEDIIKRLTYCDLLVLDDVGKEARQDPRFVQRTLFAIIDGRYKLDKPMVLTANGTIEQLKSHLGNVSSDQASFDRIWEMTEGKALAIDGESYRRRK